MFQLDNDAYSDLWRRINNVIKTDLAKGAKTEVIASDIMILIDKTYFPPDAQDFE